ncbi:geranylgeranyl reductase family protein [Candidatus Woesearchaeota archaeon]|nr:geranylgeranyl reductase family protein [Candidatus Woesearchaeota archaeon]
MKKEVVIVGAGPGGLSAAETLANAGKEVLVLEQNKIIGNKVCAGGLTRNAMKLGIPKSLYQRTFKKILLHDTTETAEIELTKPVIATIDRKDLGRWMAKKAKKAGAEIQTETSVKNIGKNYIETDDQKIQFKYLIGADGANSIVRKHLGLESKKVLEAFQYIVSKRFKDLEMFVDPDRFGPVYAWIFPYSKTTSIGTGADLDYKGIKPSTVKNNFDKWCMQRGYSIKNSEFQAHTINYDYSGYEFKRKFLVGDAGGFASGLTGGGMYQAIISGKDTAKKIIDSKYGCPNIHRILQTKAIEEAALGVLEINKTASKIGYGLLTKMCKTQLLGKFFVEHMA